MKIFIIKILKHILKLLNSAPYPNNSRTVSGSVAVEKNDVILLCNTVSSACTLTLQEIPSNYLTTYKLYVKDSGNNAGTNNITILAPSGYKINGASSYTININGASVEISISSTTDYLLVNGYASPSPSTSYVLLGSRNLFVSKSGSDSTGATADLAHSYLTVGAALTAAAALTPSSSNPININIYPGVYVEDITVPQYVNIIGVMPTELYFSASGYSTVATKSANALGQVYINGTITQSADNVKIVGVNCNILAINSTNTNSSYSNIIASTSITSNQASVAGTFYDVHSLLLLGNVSISATMSYCTGGDGSFAGSITGNAYNITGTFMWCIGAAACFSSTNFAGANAGNISGRMIDCIATDSYSFASTNSGTAGTISATLINCRAGIGSYASALDTGIAGTISGTLQNCLGSVYSYASGANSAGTISGRLQNCVSIGSVCFASSNSNTLGGGLIASTAFLSNCTANTTGSFCSNLGVGTQSAGTIAGTLIGCWAKDYMSFASSASISGGVISGRVIDCVATMVSFACCGDNSLNLLGIGGTISGVVQNCITTADLNYGNGLVPGTISGTLIGCNAFSNIAFSSVNLTGKLIRCRARNNSGAAIRVSSDAIIEYCDLKGSTFSVVSNSGSSTPVDIRHTNLFGGGVDSNIVLVTSTPYNTNDTSSLF